jgi:Ca-activated chloride channel family protein
MNLGFHFNNPHVLWLALLVPVYLWISRRRPTTAAVRYPSVRHLQRLPRSLRQRCRFVLPLLRTVALLLLIVVLARPVYHLESQEQPSQGIAIAMLLDRSASMGDSNGRLMYNDKLALRFDIAKDVFERFIKGDKKDMEGRPNDLVGLYTFATYPQTDHPFSLDHASLLNAVKGMSAEKPFLDEYGRQTDDIRQAAVLRDQYGRRIPRTNPLQMTDIKKAIEYTADKLSLLSEDLARSSTGLRQYDLKSKVMVLLTDGEPTVSEGRNGPDYPDDETIKRLTDAGIKVYFVQILAQQRYRERPDGTVEVIPMRGGGLFGSLQADQETAMANQAIEEARKLARRTGGRHFLATSGDKLKAIYEEIDRLERSNVGGRTVLRQGESYHWYLTVALALLGAECVLGLTLLRRSP